MSQQKAHPDVEIAPLDQTPKRAPYSPPQVTYVEIEVEEALLSICKSGTGPGPTGACSIPCYSNGS